MAREKWDEADSQVDPDEDSVFAPQTPHASQSILPDWTRTPLPVGAPPAKPPQPTPNLPAVAPVPMPVLTVGA